MTRTVLFAFVMALAMTLPASADLVVFEDGQVVKAASYKVVEDELEIGLAGGGSYRVELNRVERIVDDEIADTCLQDDPVLAPLTAAFDLSYREDRKPLFHTPYDQMIVSEAKRFGVDASLVSAVIRAESNYEPRAVSRKGARGLMPATARRLSLSRPFDPVANVQAGVRYLKELLDRFQHRPDLVLAAYNAGENAVDAYGGVPPYRETINYIKRILSMWTPALAATVAPAAAPATRASS
jgi:hypothetical protein